MTPAQFAGFFIWGVRKMSRPEFQYDEGLHLHFYRSAGTEFEHTLGSQPAQPGVKVTRPDQGVGDNPALAGMAQEMKYGNRGGLVSRGPFEHRR